MRVSSTSCSSLFVLALLVAATSLVGITGTPTLAQEAAQPATGPRPLITQPIDESQLTTLKGNLHPLARPVFDVGTAPATLPMERMLLVLKRSPEQEAALRKLLDDQQDKASPSYHKWLTPEQFGKQFGPSDDDLQKITAWLQSHGFQVGKTKGRTVLEFSGSASQVQEAFHTSIHKYVVNGEQHWANATNPMIPTALTGAVGGVASLHNFLKKPHYRLSKAKGIITSAAPGKPPHVTFTDGTHGLAPGDYAVIYNINPVYSTMNINGSGITIGVIGRSDILFSDVTDFQSLFNLTSKVPTQVLNGPDPGDVPGDDVEGTLDVTWSQAIAPGATVDFVNSATTNTTDGVDLSALYIVENNLANVMTQSFGTCEAEVPDSYPQFLESIAEQAAAQGITYTASTGDAGAEDCDDPNSESVATGPISADLPGSTPFTVAVGGTEFNEGTSTSTYWSSTNTNGVSALTYIPEEVWNDSCTSTSCGTNANISAGGGGSSTGNVASGVGTFAGFPKPVWQTGFGDTTRDIPDVSLTASIHDGYALCFQGSCASQQLYLIGGTSASTPSFAAIMALVDQRMGQVGTGLGETGWDRQGQADYVLYSLFANETSNLTACNATTLTLPNTCTFNDVTSGNNEVPGEPGYPSAPYNSAKGYDEASGLGSVNVDNLITNWASATFRATTTALTINGVGNGNTTPVAVGAHGTSATFAVTVAASSGPATPAPTGDVSLIAAIGPTGSLSNQTSVAIFTLTSGGTFSGSTRALPGGQYTVTAHYAGNSTTTATGIFAPSDSASPGVLVNVGKESSTTTFAASSGGGVYTMDQFGGWSIPVTTAQPFGTPIMVTAVVTGTSGFGLPTGSVVFGSTSGTIPNGTTLSLNTEGEASVQSDPFLPSGPTVPFDAGSYSISANYQGDNSFTASSTASPASLTIQPGFAMVSGLGNVTIATPGGTGQTTVGIIASTGFTTAITFACSNLPAEATCSPASATGKGPTTVVSTNITINTTAAHTTMLHSNQRRYYYAVLLAGGFPLAGIFVIAGPRRRRWSTWVGLILLMAFLVAVPACGGGGGGPTHQLDPGTPVGTYTVTLSATAGSVSEQGQFILVVQ
jgi:Pro-kumamolisin, activation domain/Bacterial Ig-like domain (group 3)